jgi:rRNA maturation endonuclease Nob1
MSAGVFIAVVIILGLIVIGVSLWIYRLSHPVVIRRCTNCNAIVRPTDHFCPNCGKELQPTTILTEE